jgi:hypothetical protein
MESGRSLIPPGNHAALLLRIAELDMDRSHVLLDHKPRLFSFR